MKKLIYMLLILSTGILAQPDQLNRLDSKGRKHGKHMVYLDKHWKELPDSTEAAYSRFTWFEHGTNLYPMGTSGKNGFTLLLDSAAGRSGKLLNGLYIWLNEEGIVSSIHSFDHGSYLSCEEYDKDGTLKQQINFTQKCRGEQHGCTVYIYNRAGDIREVKRYCRDQKGEWTFPND